MRRVGWSCAAESEGRGERSVRAGGREGGGPATDESELNT